MLHQSLEIQKREIKRRVAALGGGPGRRYPAELLAQITEYARGRLAEGARRSHVVAELGVSSPTVNRLVSQRPQKFRPVRVVSPPKEASVTASLVVKGPAGLVVEGLDVAGVAALFRAMS